MDRNKKINIAIVLFIVILVMLILMVLNLNTWFRNEVVLTYPDNCTEVYINGNLQGSLCVRGREMVEKYKEYENNNLESEQPQWNFTNFNSTEI